MNLVKIKHRPTFLYNYLQPSIEHGVIEFMIPDKPTSNKQKYRLTPKGKKLQKQLKGS
jgi:predicted transcriptional regulator